MRYYLRFGEGGLNYVDSDLALEEFTREIRLGNSIHPLYDAKGQRKYNYPKGLSHKADIFPAHPFIPFDGRGTKYLNEQGGFVIVPIQYDKTKFAEVLSEMDFIGDLSDKFAVEDFITKRGTTFLRKINCTIFNDEMYDKCIIDETEEAIIFISKYCMLMQGDRVLVIFGRSILELKDESPYKLFYIPCTPEDLLYKTYG
jgi:hypothetical protein